MLPPGRARREHVVVGRGLHGAGRDALVRQPLLGRLREAPDVVQPRIFLARRRLGRYRREQQEVEVPLERLGAHRRADYT